MQAFLSRTEWGREWGCWCWGGGRCMAQGGAPCSVHTRRRHRCMQTRQQQHSWCISDSCPPLLSSALQHPSISSIGCCGLPSPAGCPLWWRLPPAAPAAACQTWSCQVWLPCPGPSWAGRLAVQQHASAHLVWVPACLPGAPIRNPLAHAWALLSACTAACSAPCPALGAVQPCPLLCPALDPLNPLFRAASLAGGSRYARFNDTPFTDRTSKARLAC